MATCREFTEVLGRGCAVARVLRAIEKVPAPGGDVVTRGASQQLFIPRGRDVDRPTVTNMGVNVPRRKKLSRRVKGGSKDKTPVRSAARQTKNRVLARIAKDQQLLKELEKREKTTTPARAAKRTRAEPVSEPVTKVARTKQDEADQRFAIRYYYRTLDSPPEEDWDGHCGTVSEIRRLMLPDPPGAATVRRMSKISCACRSPLSKLSLTRAVWCRKRPSIRRDAAAQSARVSPVRG